jgi:lauroyl/myristoyl acyltransferase
VGVIRVLNAVGKLIAVMPRPLLRMICFGFGPIIGWVRPSRKRQALASLTLAFPGYSRKQIKRIYRENARRLIEMGLLVVALPHFSKQALRSMIAVDEATERQIRESFGADPQRQPAVLLIPHLTLSELLTAMPGLVDFPLSPTKVIFRPIPSAQLDRWVHESRSRHGVELLSRKLGFSQAMRALERRETVGVLFDQKAGGSGSLITFFDRICLASELPGILVEKYRARAFAAALERTDFWRAQLRLEELDCQPDAAAVTFAAHEWLQCYLSASEDHAADWLWLHDRWGSFYKPVKRFMLVHKRDLLAQQNERLGRTVLPRKESVWCLLPDSAKEAAAFLPVIEAMRRARPDFAITLVAADGFIFEWLKRRRAEAALLLPQAKWSRLWVLWRYRNHYPASVLVFDSSPLAALGAWLSRCPQRFGMRNGSRRRLGVNEDLGRIATTGARLNAATISQSWLIALERCGLTADSQTSGGNKEESE